MTSERKNKNTAYALIAVWHSICLHYTVMIEYDVQIFIMHWKTGRHPAQSITHSKNCNDLCQGGYVFIIVCLFVSNFAQKLPNGFASNFQGRLAMDQ